MKIADSLPMILQRASHGAAGPEAVATYQGGIWYSIQALDIFECMIRVDDTAVGGQLSGTSPKLDHWALSDPDSLLERLGRESFRIGFAVLLTISPRALGQLSGDLSLFRWMEAARAANCVTRDQLQGLRDTSELEEYLCGYQRRAPRLDLPLLFPLPAPSVLRMVQNFRFRKKLLQEEGYREAMRRYIRFYC